MADEPQTVDNMRQRPSMTAKKRKTKGASPRGARSKTAPLPRLQQVESWLAENRRYGDVRAAAIALFKISPRTAARDIAAIYHRWENEEKDDRPARRGRIRHELWERYESAVLVAGDSHQQLAAARILERLCKLDGLDAPEKFNLQHTSTDLVANMTPAEREKRIAELLAKRAGEGEGNG